MNPILLNLPLTVPFLVSAEAYGYNRDAAFRAKRADKLPFRIVSVGDRCHQGLSLDLVDHFGADARIIDLIGATPGITLRDLLAENISLPLVRAGRYFRRDEGTTYYLHRKNKLPFPLVGEPPRVPVFGLLQLAGYTSEQIVQLREMNAAQAA